MFKIVKSAKIEVIKPSELKVGDHFLWANWNRRVLEIDRFNRTIVASSPYDDEYKETLKFFMNYYKIIECEEMEAPDNYE